MKNAEIKSAINLAMAQESLAQYELQACEAFNGIGIDSRKRFATMEQTAWFIRYQCLQLDGQFDMAELNDTIDMLRKKVVLIG